MARTRASALLACLVAAWACRARSPDRGPTPDRAPAAAASAAPRMGAYTFRTLDGYEVTTGDTGAPTVILVWSLACKPCTAMRDAAMTLSASHPGVRFLAISRDTEDAWRSALGAGTPLIEVLDDGGRFAREMTATDGTLLFVGADRTVRYRGPWGELAPVDLERRVDGLQRGR